MANKRQKLINKVTGKLLDNERWLYGKPITAYKEMRQFVKKHKLV